MSNAFEPQFTDAPVQEHSSGTNKGCLIGCLVAGGLFVGAILCAGVGIYMLASKAVDTYTSTTPAKLETVEYTEEEMAALKSRVESFREKLNAGETPEEDLELTADDINAWIATDENLKGKFFVEIKDDQVHGDVSLPLDGMPMGEGRYFNGSGTFDVSMEGGVLIVTMQQAEVNGDPVPESVMQGFRSENLANEIYKKPENAEFMRKFEDIRIEDNRFILRVKRDSPEEAPPEEAPPEEAPPEEAPPAATEDDMQKPPA
ncbi:hypothetical protein U8335_03805 [Roseiconus lacunae]|uniref:hypothetical protein n=1 Tax=Roseiconus lacunae TaxID=2605694 RepID=UPI003092A8CF|nr:hypothetical protein U8335_03805 [Stieleria sp. HD01]